VSCLATLLGSSAAADRSFAKVDPLPTPALVATIDGTQYELAADANGSRSMGKDGTVFFTGSHRTASGAGMSWTIAVGGSAAVQEAAIMLPPPPFIILASLVANNAASTFTANFTLAESLPATLPGLLAVAGGASIGLVLDTALDGASAFAPAGTSSAQFLIDAIPFATLFDDPFLVTAGAGAVAVFPPASFGSPIPSMPILPPTASIGLILETNVSAHDLATVSATFVVN